MMERGSGMGFNPMMMGNAASMLGSGLAGFFGSHKNPYDKGTEFYDQISRMLPGYFDPWMSAGKSVLPGLQEQYGKLMNDPGSLFNKFASGYQTSPGYQWQQKQGQEAALNAMAAGGMAGSPQHQQYASQISQDIANQDFYNYLSKILGLYGTGLQGQQGLSTSGLAASMGLGEDLASILARQAENAIRGEETEQKGNQMDWGNILGGIGSLAGMFMGGPAGGMAGGAIGKGIGGLF